MQPPAIPFLGVYLTDLTFLDLGNPDFLPESHFINFEKRRKVFQLVREIQKYQNTMFPFTYIPQVQELMGKLCDPARPIGWANSGLIMTEDELYDKSTTVEPKEASSDEDN
jgi:son of sevenless